jgi:hypothetical protein
MPARAAIVAAVVVATTARAAAEPPVPRPRAPHLLHVPTAWVLSRDTAWARAGADHRGGGVVGVTGSLAGLAEVDLEVARDADDAWPGSAAIKLGGAWRRLAGAVGVRRSFWGRDVAVAYAAASAELGPVRAHAGGAVIDATGVPRPGLRPLAGIEWTPAQYPRTTVLADLGWSAAPDADRAALRWTGGWGVRYQALAWGSIELAVRHRQGDGLDGSTVMVRVNGARSVRPE